MKDEGKNILNALGPVIVIGAMIAGCMMLAALGKWVDSVGVCP